MILCYLSKVFYLSKSTYLSKLVHKCKKKDEFIDLNLFVGFYMFDLQYSIRVTDMIQMQTYLMILKQNKIVLYLSSLYHSLW